MEAHSWLALATFSLNLWFIPLLKLLFDIKAALVKLETEMALQKYRMDRIDTICEHRHMRRAGDGRNDEAGDP
jgi:hypothetical protein